MTDPYDPPDPFAVPGPPPDLSPRPGHGTYPYPGPPVQPGTDGLAIAALVTGILQTGPVAVVLGILGLRRVNRTGREGRGMAITGIVLGAVTTAFALVILVVVGIGVLRVLDDLDHGYGDDPVLDALWESCDDGDMAACDLLYEESGFGTDYESFGDTCGGRTRGGTHCAAPEG